MSQNRYRIQVKLMIGLLIAYAFCNGAFGDSKVVIYPRAHSDIDRRTEYPAKLLELALKQVDSGYTLLPTAIVMQQDRALKELSNTRTVDVVWSMTSIEREQELLPIRIPIHRGLIGWRLFLIKQSEAEALSSITTASQLKKMILLQGQHWPDTTILQASGFTVMSSVHYDGIFDCWWRVVANFSLVRFWKSGPKLRFTQTKVLSLNPSLCSATPRLFTILCPRTTQTLPQQSKPGCKSSWRTAHLITSFSDITAIYFRKQSLQIGSLSI